MKLKHIFKSNKGFLLIEALLGIFIFSFIITTIFAFIKTENSFYKKNSAKIISRLMFRELEKNIKNDFSSIDNLFIYKKNPLELKIIKNNKTITYLIKNNKNIVQIIREKNNKKEILTPKLEIKKFSLNLININGNRVFDFNRTSFLKFDITYKENHNNIFHNFIVIEKNNVD